MSVRAKLPNRRGGITFEIVHGQDMLCNRFLVSVGHTPDGEPIEVFVSAAKTTTDIEALARDGAILISIARQYGAPLEVLQNAITRDDSGRPMTIIGAVLDLMDKEPPKPVEPDPNHEPASAAVAAA